MPKPSKRIKEIVREKLGYEELTTELEIIAQYLDEQYEKNKPCEHKNITDDLVCEDCGEAKR